MVAVGAAQRIAAPRREGGEWDALISIAFSVITLEASLNEATEFAAGPASGSASAAVFAQVMGSERRDHPALG